MSLTSLLQGSPDNYNITGHESHLTVKDCPGFVVEINSYNITGNDYHVTYLSLAAITWHYNITGNKSQLIVKGCPGFVVEFNSYNITGDESHVIYLSLAGITGGTEIPRNIICNIRGTKQPRATVLIYFIIHLKKFFIEYNIKLPEIYDLHKISHKQNVFVYFIFFVTLLVLWVVSCSCELFVIRRLNKFTCDFMVIHVIRLSQYIELH